MGSLWFMVLNPTQVAMIQTQRGVLLYAGNLLSFLKSRSQAGNLASFPGRVVSKLTSRPSVNLRDNSAWERG